MPPAKVVVASIDASRQAKLQVDPTDHVLDRAGRNAAAGSNLLVTHPQSYESQQFPLGCRQVGTRTRHFHMPPPLNDISKNRGQMRYGGQRNDSSASTLNHVEPVFGARVVGRKDERLPRELKSERKRPADWAVHHERQLCFIIKMIPIGDEDLSDAGAEYLGHSNDVNRSKHTVPPKKTATECVARSLDSDSALEVIGSEHAMAGLVALPLEVARVPKWAHSRTVRVVLQPSGMRIVALPARHPWPNA